jgi:asparagine synthase (glutamine-hydrolysing)
MFRYEHDPNITAKELRDELEVAVVKRMMSDVEFGLFLSGGIDSCIVGTLMRPHVPASKRLPSFCVGMADSPDITAAREIAGKLGYDHSEVRLRLRLSYPAPQSLISIFLPRDGPTRWS